MPVPKARTKSLAKRRNILRNNVSKLNHFRVERGFFPKAEITPWWFKRAQ